MCKNRHSFILPVLFAILQFAPNITPSHTTSFAYPSDEPALSVNAKHLQAIENYMDLTEDPCDDFYGYTCGNWPEHHTSEHYTETTGLIDHKVNKRLLDLLKGYHPREEQPNQIYDQAWTYYRSCKREKKLKLLRYLQIVRPNGHLNWPVLDKLKGNAWAKEKFNWLLTLAKLQRYGLQGTLFNYQVLPKANNSQEHIVDLDMPTLEDDEKLPSKYVIAPLLIELGVKKRRAIEIAAKAQEFEQLIRILRVMGDGDDDDGTLEWSLQQLIDVIPMVPWRKYFSILLGYEVNANFTLQIQNRKFFLSIIGLIEMDEPANICNYLMVKFLYYVTLDNAISFGKIDCLVDLREKMPMAVNFIYLEKIYRHDAENYNAEVYGIFEALKAEFHEKLELNKFNFSPAQMEYLKAKMDHMQINIGNLPRNRTAEIVQNFYKDLQLDVKNYYKNHLSLLEWRTRKQQELLVASPQHWDEFFFIPDSDTGRESTTFYLMRHNLIVVPFGIVQPPMFHKNMHDVFKLSLFGFLMAHEIAHGFDASGVTVDFRGTSDSHFNITDNEQFVEAVECMEEEEKTESIDERIADFVGIRLAYDALFKANSTFNSKQPNFTQIPIKRLFFLSFAHFFCGNLETNFQEHDSDNIRLQQTLMHFEPFAEAFQCQLGDAMHAERKCRLW